MKKSISVVILLFMTVLCFGQKVNVVQMPVAEIQGFFTKSVNDKFNISFPIWKAYHITDVSGSYYIALTEKYDGPNKEDGDSLHSAIKAICLQQKKDSLIKKWEINDFAIKGKKPEDFSEYSIWFWTKYCSFADLDKDGLADPIVIYGTGGWNNYDDGRIKFIIYYKNKKIAIRHQNGVLDDERNTQIDASFYQLPQALQDFVKKTMHQMQENNHAIFPYNWEKAMLKKSTFITERNTSGL